MTTGFYCPTCQLLNEFAPPAVVFCPICHSVNVLFVAGQDGVDYHCFGCDSDFEYDSALPFTDDNDDPSDFKADV